DFRLYKFVKYSHYLLATLAVGFWGIFYLTYEIFPFNLGGLILLLFVYYLLINYYREIPTQILR
ncbi:MAG: hypothetical protein ACW96X_12360, partial [Promethearchaeota archaeon]